MLMAVIHMQESTRCVFLHIFVYIHAVLFALMHVKTNYSACSTIAIPALVPILSAPARTISIAPL